MSNTIRLFPGMDYDDLVRALNQNFAILENSRRTQIIRDDNGVNRIIFGRLPDGEYGLVISKAGEDVINLLGY